MGPGLYQMGTVLNIGYTDSMSQLQSLPTEYLVFAGVVLFSILGVYWSFRKVASFRGSIEETEPEQIKSIASKGADFTVTGVTLFALVWKLSPLVFSTSTVLREPLALLYLPGGTGGTWLAAGAFGAYTAWTYYRQGLGVRRFLGIWLAALLLVGIPAFRVTDLVRQGAFRTQDENYGPYLGMEAPDFVLPLLAGPDLVDPNPDSEESREFSSNPDLMGARGVLALSALRGTPVLLNFWATWCPPCRAEFPELVALQREFGDEVRVVAVNLTTSELSIEDVARFVNEKDGHSITHVLDTQGTIGLTYQARVVPTTVLIDGEGMIRFRRSGAVSRDLLAGPLSGLVAEAITLQDQR